MEMDHKQLGPYEIGEKLGAGGMGTVYAAIDGETGEPAAVKVLAPALAMQQGFRERFEAEIESLKKLEHPHIVKLFGYGKKESFLFYGMELVPGANLEEELVNGRRFDWREVTEIGIKLARALKLAHDHGVIHRDIKPANVLMSEEGEIKLSDFGVARLFGNTGLTNEGGVLGTAEYMAPEQADGSRVTHHCDLYSLGGVLYALLAGRPPFRSKSMLELLQLQRFATPDGVRRYAPETPRELEQIIAQLLSKEPTDRFPNALMLSRRLEVMEKGLTLKAAADSDAAEPPGVTLAETSQRTYDQPDSDGGAGNLGDTIDRQVDEGGSNNGSQASSDRLAVVKRNHDDEPPEDFAVDVLSDHFTTIEEERTRELISEREAVPLISLPTIVLIVSLITTSFLIWYWVRPPSEADLLREIEEIAQLGDDVRLREVEEEITVFLQLYSESEYAERIENYQDRLNTARLSGRSLRQATDLLRRYPDSIVAGDYVDAIRIISSQPEDALAKLEAIVDLYGKQSARKEDIRPFVEAANRQIPRLRQRVENRQQAFRAEVEQRLDRANRMQNSSPREAAAIRRAVIDLYGDKAWAVDLVTRARDESVFSDDSGPADES